MLISRSWLVPHLATLVLDEYRGHHTEMMAALHDAAERVTQDAPRPSS